MFQIQVLLGLTIVTFFSFSFFIISFSFIYLLVLASFVRFGSRYCAEAAEVAEILAEYGIEHHEYTPVVNALRKNPQAWLDFMMK